MTEFADLAREGAVLTCRVTPKARQAGISRVGDLLEVRVTAPPDKGKANRAVQEALAKALGWPKTRVVLISGATARIKRFRLDGL